MLGERTTELGTTMKSKFQFKAPTAILILLIPLALATAQSFPQPRAPAINNATGLPAPPPGYPQYRTLNIDPTTGLPLPTPSPEAQWLDPNWKDPDITLANVEYDGLPLSEVAKHLREQFKNQFDILPMPQTFGKDWGNMVVINLQLKNVKASEVFNAMNLVFENDRTPLRWELKATPHPLVLLRVLPEATPEFGAPNRPQETHRMVYFVGNLLGDEKSGGMTLEQIVKTITDVWPADFGKPDGVIQFHKEAQLLVVNGTPEQLEFIHQALAALEQKAQHERAKHDDAERIAAAVQAHEDWLHNRQKTNSADVK